MQGIIRTYLGSGLFMLNVYAFYCQKKLRLRQQDPFKYTDLKP